MNVRPSLILQLLIAALFIPSATSEVFYVARNGNDSLADGSADRPWSSISAAIAAVPETGGTIIVRDGVYNGRARINRKFKNWLVIRAENKYRARLEAAQDTTLLIHDAAFVEITGFDISRSTRETAHPLAAQIARAENIILRNNILHDSRNNDVLKVNEGSRHVLIIGNVFYNPSSGAGQHIDVNGCTDVTIRDNIFFNDFEGGGENDPNDTSSFIIIKNSADLSESRRTHVTSNVFLNWEGSLGKNFVLLGEDGKRFHETQDVLVENNLMLGNSSRRMRSAFGAKGVKDVVYRNNTIVGDLPSSAFAMRLNREGDNPRNRNLRFFNNIWSDPTGSMNNFSDGQPDEAVELELRRNLYWNGGSDLPGGSNLKPTDDSEPVFEDPQLNGHDAVVLPRWSGETFLSGATNIREEFQRLVHLYGMPAEGSPVRGRALEETSPKTDILDRIREGAPDIGAVQIGAKAPPLRVVLVPEQVTGGISTQLSQIIVDEPAGSDGLVVTLTSSDPQYVSVPESVFIAPGLSSATFPVLTIRVDSTLSFSITASYADRSQTVDLVLHAERTRDVNLAPEILIGGTGSSRNIVLIDGVAPAEGLTISLVSSHPDLVKVPETVTITAGRSASSFFPIATSFTPEPTLVTITASWGAATASGRLMLLTPPFSLGLRSQSIVSGDLLERNRVYLDRLASSGGAVVRLSSSQPDVLSVPETVTVPEGSNSAEFSVVAGSVTKRSTAKIVAVFEDRTTSANCDVSPLIPTSLTGPPTMASGTSATLRVSLNGTALAPGLAIRLEAGSGASVPPEVIVPAGQGSISFRLTAPSVTSSTKVKVSTIYMDRTISLDVIVEPPKIISMFVPASIRSGETNANCCVVTISGLAPTGGLSVALTSSDPSLISVTETGLIPEGKESARFALRASTFNSPGKVSINAVLGESVMSRSINLVPAQVASLTLPESVQGGTNFTLSIGFRGTPVEGSSLELTTSLPDVVTLPAIPALTPSTSTIRLIISTRSVSEPVEATMTASYAGSSQEKKITIRP